MSRYYLGIDTSNYKTSIAAVDDNGDIIVNLSEYLEVALGDKGLRQSDAFFKHSARLPSMLKTVLESVPASDIAAVGVSDKPRRVEGSYMPCFMAGVNFAKTLTAVLGVELHTFSHQEGHAAAVIEACAHAEDDDKAILMHLSGGTTEFLKCQRDDEGYETEIVGGTLDISIGQLLDRFGVALGFPFPSGRYIDDLAASYKGKLNKPEKILSRISVNDGYFNLSGQEKRLMDFAELYTQKHGKIDFNYDLRLNDEELGAASYEVFDAISELLAKSASYLAESEQLSKVYMAGGVASSANIRKMIKDKLKDGKPEIIFGEPLLSSDNAVGTAFLCKRIAE